MNRKGFTRYLSFILGAVTLFIASYFLLSNEKDPKPPHPSPEVLRENKFGKLNLDGVSIVTNDQLGRPVLILEAERVVQKKRRIGHIILNPIKEIILENVKIELNHYRQTVTDDMNDIEFNYNKNPGAGDTNEGVLSLPAGDMLQGIIGRLKSGIISRVSMNGIEVVVMMEGKQVFEMSASKATIGYKSKKVTFNKDFEISSTNGYSLKASKAYWQSELLSIPGRYSFVEGQSRGAGVNGTFSLDLDGNIKMLAGKT